MYSKKGNIHVLYSNNIKYINAINYVGNGDILNITRPLNRMHLSFGQPE